MTDNKTKPTTISVDDFLVTADDRRRAEARILIKMMRQISAQEPVMWGPSIIGFGSQHYKYDSGREGDMPRLGFSPRKASLTIYFSEGFDRHSALLSKLGKHKISVSCLYVKKLDDIDMEILRQMLEQSYKLSAGQPNKPTEVEEYIARVPEVARPHFDELHSLVRGLLPNANEVLSYGIIGYKIDNKRARVFISGWRDHVAMYPIPKDEALRVELAPFIKGKGTLWFALGSPLPKVLIKKTVRALVKANNTELI